MERVETKIIEELRKKGLPLYTLYGSKTLYSKTHLDDLVLFNANIFIDDLGKVWYGDINLTKHWKDLMEIKERVGVDIYVLYEMDGRFGKEDREDFENVAIWSTKNGLTERYAKYFDPTTLKKLPPSHSG
jgi:hypothetical protein